MCVCILYSSLIFSSLYVRACFRARTPDRMGAIAWTQAREKMCVLTFVNTVFCLSGIDVTPRINHGN